MKLDGFYVNRQITKAEAKRLYQAVTDMRKNLGGGFLRKTRCVGGYYLTDIERKAHRLFRVLNGKGDAGSVHEFLRQRPSDWVRLARYVERNKEGK